MGVDPFLVGLVETRPMFELMGIVFTNVNDCGRDIWHVASPF